MPDFSEILCAVTVFHRISVTDTAVPQNVFFNFFANGALASGTFPIVSGTLIIIIIIIIITTTTTTTYAPTIRQKKKGHYRGVNHCGRPTWMQSSVYSKTSMEGRLHVVHRDTLKADKTAAYKLDTLHSICRRNTSSPPQCDAVTVMHTACVDLDKTDGNLTRR